MTWWGESTISVQSADRTIVIDPSASLKESDFDFVFCTHEHYAHSDPETVERLTRSSRFKRMFIARSCLYPSNKAHARCLRFLSEPHWQIEKYVIFYPKHYDHTVPRGAEGDTAHLAGTGRGAWSEEIASGAWSPPNGTPRPFGGIDEIWTDGWHVEGMEMIGDDPGRAVPRPRSDATTGFLHRGPQLRRLVLPSRRQPKTLSRDGSDTRTPGHPLPARRENEPRRRGRGVKADGASLRRTCGMATRNRVIRRRWRIWAD